MTKPKVVHNTGQYEWGTPKKYTDIARLVMLGIDLDPASNEMANKTVRANKFYSQEVDGLAQDWNGKIWLNPPYSRKLLPKFVNKLMTEYIQGSVEQACVLINNSTETKSFHEIFDISNAICFLKGRIKFLNEQGVPAKTPLQGQVVFYIGENTNRFKLFNQVGRVFNTN